MDVLLSRYKKILIVIFVLSGLVGISTCSISSRSSTPGPTPPFYNYGSTPLIPNPLMPETLDCSKITTVTLGPSWKNLRIGKTTFSQMRKQLEPVSIRWDGREGNLRFENVAPIPDQEWGEWSLLEACFIGDKLSALNSLGAANAFPRTSDGWISEYGEPEYVTWGSDYYDRSFVWPTEGILAVIDVLYEEVVYVILYSPIPKENWETSWLYTSLPKEPHEFPGSDLPELPPWKEVENPWAILGW